MLENPGLEPRTVSRRKLINRLDPIYQLLDRTLFARLFGPDSRSHPPEGGPFNLDFAEQELLVENLRKHRLILWLNVVLATGLLLLGAGTLRLEEPIVVAYLFSGLIGPGIAWYTMSLSGIPGKHLGTALVLTFWLFLAFSIVSTVLFVAACSLVPWWFALGVLAPTYISVYCAAVLHDNLDGLRIGPASEQLRFSRAVLLFRKEHAAGEYPAATRGSSSSLMAVDDGLVAHHVAMIEQSIDLLEARPKARVANHLLASICQQLVRLVAGAGSATSSQSLELEGDPDFVAFVRDAHRMSVPVVDERTVGCLRLVLEDLRRALGNPAAPDLETAARLLRQFELARRQADAADDTDAAAQEFADHLFSQVFRLLLSLVRTHRTRFSVTQESV